MREQRQQAIEDHVKQVNELIKEAQAAGQDDGAGSQEGEQDKKGDDEWSGFQDDPPIEPVDREEEYIDEDRYTTVTVEAVTVDRDGMHKPEDSSEDDDETKGDDDSNTPEKAEEDGAQKTQKVHPPKRKKPKFRYENKLERQFTQRKQRAHSNKKTR